MLDLGTLSPFVRGDVEHAFDRLLAKAPSVLLRSPGLRNALRRDLATSLLLLAHRTLIAQQRLMREHVDFATFAGSLDDPRVRARIDASYPVLNEVIEGHLLAWVDNAAELLIRLEADAAEVAGLLDMHTEEVLPERIHFGRGDPHRGGRTVAVVEFARGARIVYKPRPSEVDREISSTFAAISRATGIELRLPRTLVREGYGWCEHVDQADCRSTDDLGDFHERLGALLAVLHCFHASDFHYENLIACGSHPVLIDLETILCPHSPIVGTETNESFDDTVLRVGLLPSRMIVGDRIGPDIGGGSDVAGQDGILERLIVSTDAAGEPVFERRLGKLVGGLNVPTLRGRPMPMDAAGRRRFGEGFAKVYEHVMDQRARYLDDLQRFADCEVRVLFRNTVVYSHLLEEALHPGLLLSAERMDAHLGSIARLNRDHRVGELITDAELDSLRRRDVPNFSCLAGSRDLLADGRPLHADFFRSSGLAVVADRIARLTSSDMARQLWIIERAFELDAELRGPTRSHDGPTPRILARADPPRRASSMADVAEGVVGALRRSVWQDADEAAWLVVRSFSKDGSTLGISPAFYDMYAGMPGEIVLLREYARIAGDHAADDLADRALAFLERRLREARYAIRPLGLFAGWGSVLWLRTILAKSGDGADHAEEAERLLAEVPFEELIAIDGSYSLIKGAAGLIYACAEIHAITGSRRSRELGEKALSHLLSARHAEGPGLSWRIASASPLSGLSHGASGFAVAFARMFAATQDERFHNACLETLKFEATLFDPVEGNWEDRRDVAVRSGERFAMSWAHGAPGIGIARLAIMQDGVRSNDIVGDVEAALEAVSRHEGGEDPAVISGGFGRAELLLRAEEVLGRPPSRAARWRLDALLPQGIDSVRRTRVGNFPHGLLGGLTGIGYQALRMSDPSVPRLIGLQSLSARPQQSSVRSHGATYLEI